MTSALFGAFFFTIALLVTTAYFFMGGLPLLILKHDVPVDARFIRGFFNVYYRAAFVASIGACLSYAAWGRYPFAIGTAGIALVVTLLRRHLLDAMRHLGERIEVSEPGAIRRFRRVHAAALAINIALLVLLVWGLIRLSRQIS